MTPAWEASAAAAGALMLLDRASEELKALQRAAEGAALTVITPRTTRLVRAADLQAFQRAIVDCHSRRSGGGGARLRRHRPVAQRRGGAAADDRELPVRGVGSAQVLPDIVTRDELYARLRERLPGAPAPLTAFDREVLLRRSAHAARTGGRRAAVQPAGRPDRRDPGAL